jgi:hypothetical protein
MAIKMNLRFHILLFLQVQFAGFTPNQKVKASLGSRGNYIGGFGVSRCRFRMKARYGIKNRNGPDRKLKMRRAQA